MRNGGDPSDKDLIQKEAMASKKILTEDAKLYDVEVTGPSDILVKGLKAADERKVYIFNELFAGDCMMQYGSRLVLNPNGTGTFDARVRSTDDDDEWKMHFIVQDGAGNPLVYLPARIKIFNQWIHPFWVKELPQPEHGYYDWHIDFGYDASAYNQFAGVTAEYSC